MTMTTKTAGRRIMTKATDTAISACKAVAGWLALDRLTDESRPAAEPKLNKKTSQVQAVVRKMAQGLGQCNLNFGINMKHLTLLALFAGSAVLAGIVQLSATTAPLVPLVIIASGDQPTPCAAAPLRNGDQDDEDDDEGEDDDEDDDDGCNAANAPAAPGNPPGKPPSTPLFKGAPSAVVN